MAKKMQCKQCNRLVAVIDGKFPKHRTGRSRPQAVKPICKGSLAFA